MTLPRPRNGIGPAPVAGTPAPIRVGARPTVPTSGYVWVVKNGVKVRVHRSTLTATVLAAALRMPMNGGTGTNGATPGGGGPAVEPDAPTTPTADPGIDPRDGEYQNQLGQYAFNRDRDIAEQEARRQTLPGLYKRGAADILTGYNRSSYDSNADLAQRGIIRSGEYQRRGADLLMQSARQSADLDSQYGSGAQAQIAARLAEINQQYAIQQQGALATARDRYSQRYPASTYIAGAAG